MSDSETPDPKNLPKNHPHLPHLPHPYKDLREWLAAGQPVEETDVEPADGGGRKGIFKKAKEALTGRGTEGVSEYEFEAKAQYYRDHPGFKKRVDARVGELHAAKQNREEIESKTDAQVKGKKDTAKFGLGEGKGGDYGKLQD